MSAVQVRDGLPIDQMPEWSGSALQKRRRRFNSGSGLQAPVARAERHRSSKSANAGSNPAWSSTHSRRQLYTNDRSRHRSHRRSTPPMGDWQTYAATSGCGNSRGSRRNWLAVTLVRQGVIASFCTPARRVFGTEIDSSWLCPVTENVPMANRIRHGRGALERERRYQAIREVQAAVGRELAARSEIPKTIPSRIADLLRELHRRLRPTR